MGMSAQQILGQDPEYLQRQLAQQEIQRYQNFQNPQLGLAATSGALLGRGLTNLYQGRGFFDVADPALRRVSEIQSIFNESMKDFNVDKPSESYMILSKNLASAGFGTQATMAAQEAAKYKLQETELGIKLATAGKQARAAERDELKFFKDNPEQTGPALQTLAEQLRNDPTNATLLDRYNKIAQAGTSGSIEATAKEEKATLETKKIKSIIAKNEQELAKIGTNFDAGTRWNFERQSAIDLLSSYGYKPGDKLKGADQINTELQNAQEKAMRQPWSAGGMPATPAASRPAPSPQSGTAPRVLDFSQLPPR